MEERDAHEMQVAAVNQKVLRVNCIAPRNAIGTEPTAIIPVAKTATGVNGARVLMMSN